MMRARSFSFGLSLDLSAARVIEKKTGISIIMKRTLERRGLDVIVKSLSIQGELRRDIVSRPGSDCTKRFGAKTPWLVKTLRASTKIGGNIAESRIGKDE